MSWTSMLEDIVERHGDYSSGSFQTAISDKNLKPHVSKRRLSNREKLARLLRQFSLPTEMKVVFTSLDASQTKAITTFTTKLSHRIQNLEKEVAELQLERKQMKERWLESENRLRAHRQIDSIVRWIDPPTATTPSDKRSTCSTVAPGCSTCSLCKQPVRTTRLRKHQRSRCPKRPAV